MNEGQSVSCESVMTYEATSSLGTRVWSQPERVTARQDGRNILCH